MCRKSVLRAILVSMSVFFVLFALSESAAAQSPTLSFQEIRLEKDVESGEFGLALSNAMVVEALQFRFKYDSAAGFEIVGVELTSRTEGFELPEPIFDASEPGKVEILIVLYSPQGAVIDPGEGDILTFHYTTAEDAFGEISLQFEEQILAGSNAENLVAEKENGTVSIAPDSQGTDSIPVSAEPTSYVIEPSLPSSVTSAPAEPSTLTLFSLGLLAGLFVLSRKIFRRP